MSIKNENGKGHLLISYLFKSDDFVNQIDEENKIKNEIASSLASMGYKFSIVDDDFIDKRLTDNSHENMDKITKVRCIDVSITGEHGDFTLNKIYEVVEILDNMYCIIDDVKDRNYVNKNSFEVIK